MFNRNLDELKQEIKEVTAQQLSILKGLNLPAAQRRSLKISYLKRERLLLAAIEEQEHCDRLFEKIFAECF